MCVMILNNNQIKKVSVNIGSTLATYPFSIIFAIISVPAFLFVGAMLAFHSYLIFKNLTTKEFFDGKWETTSGNLYEKKNCIKNILKVFFSVSKREVKYKYNQYLSPEHNEASSTSEDKLQSQKKSSEDEKKKKS